MIQRSKKLQHHPPAGTHAQQIGESAQDSGIEIAFRIDTSSDYHFVLDSAIIQGVQQIMGDVKVLDHPMDVQTFGLQPVYGVKSGILIQLNPRGKYGIFMPLAMKHHTRHTICHLSSTTQAAERHVFARFQAESW